MIKSVAQSNSVYAAAHTLSNLSMFLLKNDPAWLNPDYDETEERWSSITHGFAFVLSIAGLGVLFTYGRANGDQWTLLSFLVYGLSLALLYLASTLYHFFQHPPLKRKLRLFDHIGIYVVIAGTYTPFLIVGLHNRLGWIMLFVIWGMAGLGILWKNFLLGRYELLAILGYALMGILGIVILKDLLANVSRMTVIWLALGGAVYLSGLVFYGTRKIPYAHVLWHLFVIVASFFHFLAVMTLVTA